MNKARTMNIMLVLSGLYQQKLISKEKKNKLIEAWNDGQEQLVVAECSAINENPVWKEILREMME